MNNLKFINTYFINKFEILLIIKYTNFIQIKNSYQKHLFILYLNYFLPNLLQIAVAITKGIKSSSLG